MVGADGIEPPTFAVHSNPPGNRSSEARGRAVSRIGARHSPVNIAIFSTLVSTATTLRRRGDFHKRLMLLATLTILVAAIARIPLAFIERRGLSAAILLTDLCIIVVIAIDTFRYRRLHPALVWGAALFMVSMHLANIGARTEEWARFAAWLVS